MRFQSIKAQQMADSAVRLAAAQPIICSNVCAKIRDLFRRSEMIWRLAAGALVLGALGACGDSGSAPPSEQSSSTVTVSGISPSVLTKGDPQIVSSVDSQAISQTEPGGKVNTLQRDLVGLMVNERIFAYALKTGTDQVDISPTSTALYLVLKVRELTQLPADKLAIAMADIKAHPNFADFVVYIQFSIESGMVDPLNPQVNYLLLKKMRPIAESISPAKYSVASAVREGALYVASKLVNVLIPRAYAAQSVENLCAGAGAEICGVKVSDSSLEVNNFTATPYMAALGAKPSSFDGAFMVFGRDSALEKAPIGFTWNSAVSATDNWNELWQKALIYSSSFDRGSASSNLLLSGVGQGSHVVYFSSMGVCRFVGNLVFDFASPAGSTPFINNMTEAQSAAFFMNLLSLALVSADVVVGATDVKITQARASSELKKNAQAYTAKMRDVYQTVRNSKKWVEEHKIVIKSIKTSIKFLKGLSKAVKEDQTLDEATRASFENLEYAAEVLSSVFEIFNSVTEIGDVSSFERASATTLLAKSLQEAGFKWITEDLLAEGAEKLVIAAIKDNAGAKSFAELMNLAQAILDKDLVGSGLEEVAELFSAFLGKEFKLSSAIGAFTSISSSPLIADFIEKSLTGFVKQGAVKKFGKKALMQWNAVGKAVSAGWSMGTKFFPAWVDSCTAPEQLRLNVVNGQISNVEPLKVHLKIEDVTANTTILDFNEIDNNSASLPNVIDMLIGHTYRYTLRGYQKGALDRSENGSDAAHQSLDANVLKTAAGRPSQQIWSARAFRNGVLNGSRTNIHFLNQIACVYKRPLEANYHFANVKFTHVQGARFGVNCNSDEAYSNGTLYDASTDTYFGTSIELQERTYQSYGGPKSYDWTELITNHADKGFGGPFKIISNDIVHSGAQDVKSLGFAFSEFGNLAADRLLTVLVNTRDYRADSIACGAPVVGQPMTCTVKGAGLPLTSSADFALSSTACASFVEGTLAADPSTERRFVCTPAQFGSQTVTLTWSKLAQLVVSTISIASTAATTPALSPATDTGRLANDGITNNRTPVLMGTAPPYSTADIYNGTIKIGSTIADASGNWQFAVTNALGDGAHSISVRTTQGGVTVSSPAAVVTVDATAPTAPTIAQALRQANGTVTASGLAEAAALVSITWPDGVKTDVIADAATGAWSATSTSVFAAGASVTAKATDLAGNASGIASALVTTTPVAGSFSVAANLEQGTPFTVPSGVSSCTFSGRDTWYGAPSLPSGAAGTVATQDTPWANLTWAMKSAPALSLVGVGPNGAIAVGAFASFAVQPNTVINFKMNDTVGGYADNSGALSVSWQCTTAGGSINISATSFINGLNVALSANGYGADAVMNAPPYGAAANAAEWDIIVPRAGKYELIAVYAAALSRPVTISFNGAVAFPGALATTTGGWFPVDRLAISQGFVDLPAGAVTMRVARSDVFPHIKGFTLTPVNKAGSFAVAANSETGTAFVVPQNATSCQFTASGTWDTTAPYTTGPTGWGPITSWPGYTSWTWKLVSSPMMSLIASKNGVYGYIGNNATLTVQSTDNINFLANDAIGGHYDNNGSLNVMYVCQ